MEALILCLVVDAYQLVKKNTDLAVKVAKEQLRLSNINTLAMMGFGLQELRDLKDWLTQTIAARGGTSWPKQDLRDFLDNVKDRYDEQLGFENENRRLK